MNVRTRLCNAEFFLSADALNSSTVYDQGYYIWDTTDVLWNNARTCYMNINRSYKYTGSLIFSGNKETGDIFVDVYKNHSLFIRYYNMKNPYRTSSAGQEMS